MGLAPGDMLVDRYRIVRWLAQGGFGAVYLAEDGQRAGQLVAIKESLEASPRAEAQFTREAQLLAGIDHPGLPHVIDYFSRPGHAQYLVMEYIAGDDLAARLAQARAPLPEAEVVPWLLQVCAAVQYLHAQQPPIIHRDIKPANIKLTPDGRAVLVDFGIAKLYEAAQATATTARAISPGYSPIEQYGGRGTHERSDVYALGASLYHLLTRQLPPESVYRRPSEPLPSPHELNPTVSAHVAQAVLMATAYSAEDRFESVAAFAAALERPQTPVSTVRERTARRPAAETRRASAPAAQTVRRLRLRTSELIRQPRTWVFGGGAVGALVGAWWLVAQFFLPGASAVPTVPAAALVVPTASATAPLPTTSPTPTDTPPPTATGTSTATATSAGTGTATPYGGVRGGWIAFASSRAGGRRQLYLVRPDGSELTPLARSPGNDYTPAWSPDGARLAFASDRDGNWEVYTVNADGSGLVNLTRSPADDQTPAWSPDGQFIVFDSNRDGDHDLFVMRADGTEVRQLTNAPDDDQFPAWSPDGQWVAYQAHRDGYWTLYAIRPDGAQDTQLVRPAIGGLTPAWSPDGAQLVFMSFRDGPSKLYRVIFTEALQGVATVERLSTNSLDDQSPMWSPDGQQVVFSSKRTGDYELYLLTLVDMRVTRLTDSAGHDQYPAWQP